MLFFYIKRNRNTAPSRFGREKTLLHSAICLEKRYRNTVPVRSGAFRLKMHCFLAFNVNERLIEHISGDVGRNKFDIVRRTWSEILKLTAQEHSHVQHIRRETNCVALQVDFADIGLQQLLARFHPYQLRFVSVHFSLLHRIYRSISSTCTLRELLHSGDGFSGGHAKVNLRVTMSHHIAFFPADFEHFGRVQQEKKCHGLRTDPCIYVVRRNFLIHSRASPLIPKASSARSRRIVWSTVLNATLI